MVLKNYLFSEQHSSSINNMLSFPLHDVGYIVIATSLLSSQTEINIKGLFF